MSFRQFSSRAVPQRSEQRCRDEVEEELDEEEIQRARRARNREHARRSRQRKKDLTGVLQQSLQDLQEENAKLRSQIFAIIGQKKAESMITDRLAKPTERFVEALQRPENRVVDKETLSFLQGLRKKLPKKKPARAIQTVG